MLMGGPIVAAAVLPEGRQQHPSTPLTTTPVKPPVIMAVPKATMSTSLSAVTTHSVSGSYISQV